MCTAQALEVYSAGFTAVLARLAGIRPTLVIGMIERSGGSYYNTALVITHGQVVGRYRKTSLTGGESVFTPGALLRRPIARSRQA
jgi:predicted amidohydrolase